MFEQKFNEYFEQAVNANLQEEGNSSSLPASEELLSQEFIEQLLKK